ncbi:hypothetical protein TraAM80_10160 [Trypanosoma rangeli]|uniref:Uncharacterized protein n=1 Tax=Trypanosoma rangeli TaxID=5698 RepID=A0A422MQX3_TRYRA|nr:uncharacterized protein TraAM80_10160 [Trypanosoma rangeli]RNE95609.1 hypothetical protein TraAM80_10160 [Trypanosoma rangeli]|eukprot:RNE95609.1 hypothetical protein TraAM80_10160 [Trypanosoma rangeli]
MKERLGATRAERHMFRGARSENIWPQRWAPCCPKASPRQGRQPPPKHGANSARDCMPTPNRNTLKNEAMAAAKRVQRNPRQMFLCQADAAPALPPRHRRRVGARRPCWKVSRQGRLQAENSAEVSRQPQ